MSHGQNSLYGRPTASFTMAHINIHLATGPPKRPLWDPGLTAPDGAVGVETVLGGSWDLVTT